MRFKENKRRCALMETNQLFSVLAHSQFLSRTEQQKNKIKLSMLMF